jgi:hypothetical protein
MHSLSENALFKLIKERFSAPSYAVLRGVSDSTGTYKSRQADAIAMGIWPSRGLDLHGFEIKSDRRDWLREMKDPAKAEPIARYCDRWWLVVADAKMVRDGELPETWGLLAPDDKAAKLRTVKEAPKLEAVQLSRQFLAALLRRVNEQSPEKEALDAEFERGHKAGVESDKSQQAYALKAAERDIEAIRLQLHRFEEASGITIDRWDSGDMGSAVRVAQRLIRDRNMLMREADGFRKAMRALAKDTEEFVQAVDAYVGEPHPVPMDAEPVIPEAANG